MAGGRGRGSSASPAFRPARREAIELGKSGSSESGDFGRPLFGLQTRTIGVDQSTFGPPSPGRLPTELPSTGAGARNPVALRTFPGLGFSMGSGTNGVGTS